MTRLPAWGAGSPHVRANENPDPHPDRRQRSPRRRSLSEILEASDRVEVVGCVSTAVEALDQAIERCPDAVLIDLDESDAEEWLGLLSAFRCACSRAAIVVLSGAASLREVAIEAGVDAFLTKYTTADALADAVAAIATSGPPAAGATTLPVYPTQENSCDEDISQPLPAQAPDRSDRDRHRRRHLGPGRLRVDGQQDQRPGRRRQPVLRGQGRGQPVVALSRRLRSRCRSRWPTSCARSTAWPR